jgi:hypothetical protein
LVSRKGRQDTVPENSGDGLTSVYYFPIKGGVLVLATPKLKDRRGYGKSRTYLISDIPQQAHVVSHQKHYRPSGASLADGEIEPSSPAACAPPPSRPLSQDGSCSPLRFVANQEDLSAQGGHN